MALRLVEVSPEVDWRFVCTPTGNELPDVYEHWERLAGLLGRPLDGFFKDWNGQAQTRDEAQPRRASEPVYKERQAGDQDSRDAPAV